MIIKGLGTQALQLGGLLGAVSVEWEVNAVHVPW
jgi:hypothetical protein